jgi:hypothetical protein
MSLTEFLVKDVFCDETLRRALAKVLAISEQDVAVVESLEKTSGARVIAEVKEAKGDFRMRVVIYAEESVEFPDDELLAQAVAEATSSEVLVSNEDLNPYTMFLFRSSGAGVNVELDVRALDERGEFRVTRVVSNRLKG